MALRISESLRSGVIQAWLQPLSRNKVAAKLGISPASVSGIIDDWKRSIGGTRAEQLRDLATAIDRHGIKSVSENGNDFLEIASLFSEYKKLKSTVGHLQSQCSFLEGKIARLEETARISEEVIESKSQLQWHMLQLEKMGFDLKRLRRLYNIVSEANGFSDADGYAVKVFLGHVEQYYDDLIGFEKKVSELREELQNLNILRLAQLNLISAQPYVGSALVRLLNRGLQEDQIVKLANLLEMHPDMIQLFLQNSNANEGQQRRDDIKLAPSSPPSSFLLSPSFSYSISSPSHSPSPSPSQLQHSSPQTSTGSSTGEADSTRNHQ